MDGTTSHSSTSSGKTNTRLANAVRNFLAERLKKTSLRQFVPILKASAASATTVSSPSLSSKASKSQSSSKERTEPLVVELPKGKAMKFDDFAHEAKGLQQLSHEIHNGCQLEFKFNDGVFQATSTLHMGTPTSPQEQPTSADFLAVLNMINGALVGRVTANGDVFSRLFWNDFDPFSETQSVNTLMLTFNRQKDPQNQEYLGVEIDWTHDTPNYVVGAKYGHQSFPQGQQVVFSTSYSTTLLPNLQAGVEMSIMPQFPLAFIGMGLRYVYNNWIATVTANPSNQSYEATVVRKFEKDLYMSALSFGRPPYSQKPTLVPLFQFGYELNHPSGKYRATVTNFKVIQAHYKRSFSTKVALTICGLINYPKSIYKFGFGIDIEI